LKRHISSSLRIKRKKKGEEEEEEAITFSDFSLANKKKIINYLRRKKKS
jgi:hypothetical protein